MRQKASKILKCRGLSNLKRDVHKIKMNEIQGGGTNVNEDM